MPIFFVEKNVRTFAMRSFCIAKDSLISSTKNISVFGYKTLTSWPFNELVKLRMLWTTGPWSGSVQFANELLFYVRDFMVFLIVAVEAMLQWADFMNSTSMFCDVPGKWCINITWCLKKWWFSVVAPIPLDSVTTLDELLVSAEKEKEACKTTLDISKSKFILNNCYLKVNFLVSENLLLNISSLRQQDLKCKSKQ